MYDIIIWGSTKQEHDCRLQDVLDAMRAANLKLNREKCVSEVTELTFVGDFTSNECIKPDKRKVSAIEMMPRPQLKKDVQQFLGMVNYLGEFIPNLSTKAAALRKLLENKKGKVLGCRTGGIRV
ncbi:unnamed protein product [Lepidochelys kempii]